MAKANPFDMGSYQKYGNQKRKSRPRPGGRRMTGVRSGRRGKTTFTEGFLQHGWQGAGNPFGKSSGGYLPEAKKERALGYKAIKRGEDRMGQDKSLALVDKYIREMLPELAGQMPALNEQQKKLENIKAEQLAEGVYQGNVGRAARLAGRSGIGTTGRLGQSVLTSAKEQYGKQRADALQQARTGIAAGTIRNAQQAMASAANLGLRSAEARAGAAQPFTMQEAKERFGQSFPNV